MGQIAYARQGMQEEFQELFGGLTAEQADDLVLDQVGLSAEQRALLSAAAGNAGYRERFDPAPAGHLAFVPIGTKGCGNVGWHRMVPATAECRRLVNASRRLALAESLGVDPEVAAAAFTAARGYEPVLAALRGIWPVMAKCPSMSDTSLRDLGFRPRHPHEGRAIEIFRSIHGA